MASDSECSLCGRFRPFKRMKSAHRENSSGNDKYVCESLSSDSELIMEGCYGKVHEEWEVAALNQKILSGMEYKRPYVEEEVSFSDSNVYPCSASTEFLSGMEYKRPYNPSTEFEQEGKNDHSDRYSTDPPDLVSVCGIVYTSSQDEPEVTSHRTLKEPETEEIFNGASIDQSANTVEITKIKPYEERMELKEKLRCQVRAELVEVASQSKDMASLLRNLGIPVDGGACPFFPQVKAAYKQAILHFHPDYASNQGLDYQIRVEETFKLIVWLKTTLLPVEPAYLNKMCWYLVAITLINRRYFVQKSNKTQSYTAKF